MSPDEASMQAAARETARDQIQNHLGPVYKVINMQYASLYASRFSQKTSSTNKWKHGVQETGDDQGDTPEGNAHRPWGAVQYLPGGANQ
jgi:hypothetical protein